MTITGTNFSTTPNSNVVLFNGTRAKVSAATATQLTVAVPAGAGPGTRSPSRRFGQGVNSIRFATPSIGYLFGPALLMTSDGGRTWVREKSPEKGSEIPVGRQTHLRLACVSSLGRRPMLFSPFDLWDS